VVDGEEVVVDLRRLADLDVRGVLERIDLRRLDDGEVDFARLDLGHPGVAVGNHLEDDAVQVGRAVEVVWVRDDLEVAPLDELLELERPGADRIGDELGGLVQVLPLEQVLGHDRLVVAQHDREGRERPLEHKADSVFVDDFHAIDRRYRPAECGVHVRV
jgi:hypothetical protein